MSKNGPVPKVPLSGVLNGDSKRAIEFLRYLGNYAEFRLDLKRRGKLREFNSRLAKHVDGDYIDIHFIRKLMNDYGYTYDYRNQEVENRKYPEGWQFKDLYAENPQMPPLLAFIFVNLQNVPVEYIRDKNATYEKYKNLFLVHPWDAPDPGCFNMLLHYSKNQKSFYDNMMQNMMYAPEGISIFKPADVAYKKKVRKQQKHKDKAEKGKSTTGKMTELDMSVKGSEGVTGTFDQIKQALKQNEQRLKNERTLPNKTRKRVSVLWRDPKRPPSPPGAPHQDVGEGGQE